MISIVVVPEQNDEAACRDGVTKGSPSWLGDSVVVRVLINSCDAFA